MPLRERMLGLLLMYSRVQYGLVVPQKMHMSLHDVHVAFWLCGEP
jgi:hypothetical protein